MWRWRMSSREMRLHVGRSALTVASIVIGVAAVVAVGLGNGTLRRSYESMNQAVAGRAALEVTGAGDGPFEQSLLETIGQTPGVKLALPLMQRHVVMYFEDDQAQKRKVSVLALGIDAERDEAVRDYELAAGKLFSGGKGIVLDESFARGLGLKVKDKVRVGSLSGFTTTFVSGLVRPKSGGAVSHAATLFMPLDKAQKRFNAEGKIDRIQLVLDEGAETSTVLRSVAAQLPVGLSVHRPAIHSSLADETTFSLQQGMRLAIGFVLVASVFIITNTFLMNLSQRRRQLAIMRAVGATQRQIMSVIYGEALLMGIVGTGLGIVVGVGGAHLLTRAMGQLVQAPLPPVAITLWPILAGIALGIGVSLIGAIVPARQASRLTPQEALTKGIASDVESVPKWVTRFGIAGFSIALGLFFASMAGWVPYYDVVAASIVLLLTSVPLIPLGLAPLSSAVVALFKPWSLAEARLAREQLLRHRGRTTLTIGVLFVSATTAMGLAHSLMDNINDVKRWRNTALAGDLFVRASMPKLESGLSAAIPDNVENELRKVDGILDLDSVRFVSVALSTAAAQSTVKEPPASPLDEVPDEPLSDNGDAEHSLADGDLTDGDAAGQDEQKVIVVARTYPTDAMTNLDVEGFSPAELRRSLADGEVIIGSVLAQRVGLKQGDRVGLQTVDGGRQFRIKAITDDYMAGGLTVHMHSNVARQALGFEGVDVFVIRAEPGKLAAVTESLQAIVEEHGLVLQSFADVSKLIDGMMGGVVGSLWVLLVLGVIVAAFGVANTLSMNVLEQTRELAVLRVVGATRKQVRKTIIAQAAMLGVIGLLPAGILGIGMAYMMNIATAPVTGHLVTFDFHPVLWVGGPLAALVIVLLAAWFPALRASRLGPAQALRYE